MFANIADSAAKDSRAWQFWGSGDLNWKGAFVKTNSDVLKPLNNVMM